VIVLFDIDGVMRDVGGSYRRALADTVEHFTQRAARPTPEAIDALKAEGQWNNDWEASQELIYRYFEAQGQARSELALDYAAIVAFFQQKYRGETPQPDGSVQWQGYIKEEPLLVTREYFETLTAAAIPWGFVSGATRASATFVLEQRIGLVAPLLVAMEDAPGKPDPAGVFLALAQLGQSDDRSVIYVGDTVADMYTVSEACKQQPDRNWIAVGILPPHVQDGGDRQAAYTLALQQAGAKFVLTNVQELTPARIQQI
jgi:HAD superfamily phosphatase